MMFAIGESCPVIFLGELHLDAALSHIHLIDSGGIMSVLGKVLMETTILYMVTQGPYCAYGDSTAG
ncbi:MAG TPA: hypothetical protein VK578_13710 [Edaphobacter sp.]|nr:hypothetical protein [Edaphobacter sp.]